MNYSSGNSSDKELSDSSDNQEYYTHERLDQKLSELKNVLSSTDLDNDENFDPNVAANLIKKYKDNFEDIVSPTNSLLFNYASPDTSIDLSDSDSIDLGQSPISPNPIPEPEPPSHLPSTFVVQDEILLEADIPRQIIPQNTINISINQPPPSSPPPQALTPPLKPELVSELQPITVFQSEIKPEPVINEDLSPLPPPSEIPFSSSKITLPFNFLIDSRCGKSYLSVKDINELDGEIEEYIPPSELDLDSSSNNNKGGRSKNDIIYPLSYPWAEDPADFHALKREMDQITQEIEDIQTNIENGLNDMKTFDVKQDRLYNYMHNTKGTTFIPYTFNSRQIPPPPPPPEDEYIAEYNKITQRPKNLPEPKIIQPLENKRESLRNNELYNNAMIQSEYEAENELQGAKHLLGLLKREIRPRVSMNNNNYNSNKRSVGGGNNGNIRSSQRRRSVSASKLQNLKERQSLKIQQQNQQNEPPLVPYQDVIQISQSQRQPHIIGRSPAKIKQANNSYNNPPSKQTRKVITNNYIYVDPRRSVPLLPRPRKRTQPVIIYKPKEK